MLLSIHTNLVLVKSYALWKFGRNHDSPEPAVRTQSVYPTFEYPSDWMHQFSLGTLPRQESVIPLSTARTQEVSTGKYITDSIDSTPPRPSWEKIVFHGSESMELAFTCGAEVRHFTANANAKIAVMDEVRDLPLRADARLMPCHFGPRSRVWCRRSAASILRAKR